MWLRAAIHSLGRGCFQLASEGSLWLVFPTCMGHLRVDILGWLFLLAHFLNEVPLSAIPVCTNKLPDL